MNSLKNQYGFSLMELLVGIIVLSVGLLGIAGLQFNSLKVTRTSSEQTHAMIFSQDIIESMRANKNYVMQDGTNYAVTFGTALTTPGTDCFTNDCSPAALAAYELFNWRRKIYQTANNRSQFPNGDAQIVLAVDNAGNNTGLVTINFQWDKTDIGNTNEDMDVPTTFNMTAML